MCTTAKTPGHHTLKIWHFYVVYIAESAEGVVSAPLGVRIMRKGLAERGLSHKFIPSPSNIKRSHLP